MDRMIFLAMNAARQMMNGQAQAANNLANAAAWITTAALLDPQNAAVGLEAGLIAALAGDDAAARTAWTAVIALDARAPQAETARAYLSQLAQAPGQP